VAKSTLDALWFLCKHLEGEGGSDLLREMIKAFAEELMSAEVSAMCGAGYGERSVERTNGRNGYRSRQFDTWEGSIELAIP
jgi:transposase-like protein